MNATRFVYNAREVSMADHARPEGIPAHALFFTDAGQWGAGERDAAGKRIGPWKFWRQDGSYAAEAHFLDDQLHGERHAVYEDGTAAATERYEHGALRWRRAFRPNGETKDEHAFAGTPDAVAEIESSFAPDGYFRAQFLRDAAGAELARDGTPAPPRPPGLPADANFWRIASSRSVILSAHSGSDEVSRNVREVPAHELWQLCEWTFEHGRLVSRGVLQQFDTDGKLELVRYGEAYLKPAAVGKDLGKGNPLIAAAQAGDEAGVAMLFALGLHRSPQAELHAAIEGLPALARRIRADAHLGAELVDPRTAPERPTEVLTSAAWVPGLDAFVDGSVDAEGRPSPHVRLWTVGRRGKVEPQEIIFCNGVREIVRTVVTDRYGRTKEHAQHFFVDGSRAGQPRLLRVGSDGVVREETEHTLEGRTLRRRFDERGHRTVERVEQADVLEVETWWRDDARIAEVTPGPAQEDGEPSERYRAYLGDQLVADGLTSEGLDGEPIGDWTIFEGGAPVGTAPFARLDGLRMTRVGKGDAGGFALRLMRWAAAPPPPVLADILALDWDELGGWFCTNGRNIPFLLQGLALDDDAVTALVLQQLSNDVLHQATLSNAAAPVLTAMIRLVPRLRNAEPLLSLLCDCADECGDELARRTAIGGGSILELVTTSAASLREAAATSPDAPIKVRVVTLTEWAETKVAELRGLLDEIRSLASPIERCERIRARRGELSVAQYDELMKDEDLLVRFAASHFANAATSPGAIAVWREALHDFDTLAPRFRELSIGEPGLTPYLVRNFANVTNLDASVQDELPRILPRLSDLAPDMVPFVVENLLGLTFRTCELPFTSHFLAVLDALVAAQLFGRDDLDQAALRQAFANYGLPADPTELPALVARLRASADPATSLRAFMHGERSET